MKNKENRDNTIDMSRKNSKKLKVYYLPVTLTQFQKDLSEILISLHAKSFKASLIGEPQADTVNKPSGLPDRKSVV